MIAENKKMFCNDHTMELLKSRVFSDAQNTKMVASGAYFVACLCSNSGMYIIILNGLMIGVLLIALEKYCTTNTDLTWLQKAKSLLII